MVPLARETELRFPNWTRFKPICLIARVLGVSKAGHCVWRHRSPSARARQGRRQPQARRPNYDMPDRQARPAPDLVNGDFQSSGPNQLGSQHRLHPDRGGVSLSGCCPGCLAPQDHRLGNGELSATRAGPGCFGHGPRTIPTARCDRSFRLGQPVHLARFRQAPQGSRRAALDELGRRGRSLSSGRRGRIRGQRLGESFFAALECELPERRRCTLYQPPKGMIDRGDSLGR
jgi:hypothetical protein